MTFNLAALAKEKTFRLMTHSQGSLLFSEFGTRRRRSHKVHEAVIKGLIAGDREWASSEDGKKVLSLKQTPAAGGLAGTSNVSHSGWHMVRMER